MSPAQLLILSLEFDLVHQPRFYGGSLWFEGAHAPAVIEAWRDWIKDLPETATTSFGLFNLPEMPDVPPMLAGKLTLSIRYLFTGDPADRIAAKCRSPSAGSRFHAETSDWDIRLIDDSA